LRAQRLARRRVVVEPIELFRIAHAPSRRRERRRDAMRALEGGLERGASLGVALGRGFLGLAKRRGLGGADAEATKRHGNQTVGTQTDARACTRRFIC
jgi:hypothetical protein